MKLYGDHVKFFNEVKYLPKFKINLIFLGKLDWVMGFPFKGKL